MITLKIEGNSVQLETQNESLSDIVKAVILGAEAVAASIERYTDGHITEKETLSEIGKALAAIADKGTHEYVVVELNKLGK